MSRYNSPLTFAMLDSFPAIFTPPSDYRDRIAVHTSLSTSTRTSVRIKSLQRLVQQSMDSNQREVLSNRLGEIIEAYEEGWDGGSDDSEDD